MANKLFSLFDDKLRSPQDLVASAPQSLDSIGQQVVDPTAILRMIQQFEIVRPKVDFSDFANFVFFNSALDYFNITGEKILNEYPYDAQSPDIQFFLNSLDDYQRSVVDVWPHNSGHLRFNPANGFAYVLVDDVWKDGNVTRTSLLSPGTGSLSIEFWTVPPPVLTGSNDVMVLAQKISGSSLGYTVFFSGSNAIFTMRSASITDQVSVPVSPGQLSYLCFSYDRSSASPILNAFTGSTTSFPVLTSFLTGSVVGAIDMGGTRFSIGSGSISSKVVRPLTGSLDELRIWDEGKSLFQLTSSFNTKIDAQDGLSALWRFNETGSLPTGEREIVKDHSGKKLDGRITNYFTTIRGSGSLLPFDSEDLILSLAAPEVLSYIAEQQISGTAYDRDNDNLILRMLPEQFLLLEEFKNTTVIQNFLYVLARHFDQLKVSIDQFAYILKNDYGNHNQTPDALLEDIGKFFGWEFTGNFLNADAIQYIVGKQVLPNLDYNKVLDTKLFEIKNEFWKRTLVNLMHIYKTKGTRESVESMLRIYGVDSNFVRLKEYGYKPNAGIQTFRINADKSVPALAFGSGTLTARVVSEVFSGSAQTIETRIRFPTSTTSEMTASLQTGSIWTINLTPGFSQQLSFAKLSPTSLTGTLVYTGSEGSFSTGLIPMFDDKWYNVSVVHNLSTVVIDVRGLEGDTVTLHETAGLSGTFSTIQVPMRFWLGSTGSLGSQFWTQEARMWDQALSDTELQDHVLNFQSFGTEEADGLPSLSFHWRLNENLTASAGGLLYNQIVDFSGREVSGSGIGFHASTNPYRKFLNDFNYIASPEYGWNEEKIRSLSTSTVRPQDAFQDNSLIALEFNLMDALNEDISQIIATLDTFNNSIGAPVHAYRDSYVDLEILRYNYFKRLRGSVNFRLFADMLEFFDRSFVDMIRRLIPARATFLGDEFVVESHMLERPKVQWNYRRRDQQFEPEGRIQIYVRT